MEDVIRILLGDLVHPRNQFKTFPYAAGCVAAYAKAHLGEAVAIDIFRSPESLGAAFARHRPTLLGLTNYVWNLELSYEVVRQAKVAHPELVVVLGGPNYPTDADGQRAFFARYPLIDFVVYKEGEIPFLALLEQLRAVGFDARALQRQRAPIPAVHYLVDGELVAPSPAPRERSLDALPSPYLTGLLDPFFEHRDLTPIVQTKRGCPFQCTFCVEGEAYYSKLASVTTDRFRAELEYIAPRMRGGSPVLHIADSNFGMYAHDLEICDVIAAVRAAHDWPRTVEVSTGKNRKERVLEAVRRTGGAMRFGPALQTTDPQTLRNIKRANISERALIDMASAAVDLDQRSYTELILGLPGETVASHRRSIGAAMEAGLQRIKMYPLMLLPGTEMAGPAARREFGIETRFRVLPLCHGEYRFSGAPFPSVEIAELVTATSSMRFADYLACKRFELTVEIFYNDVYLEEFHGLLRGLGIPLFDFVERCHARLAAFPQPLRALYGALEEGVRDNLFPTRDACLAHFRDPAHLAHYAAQEYKNSLGTLKAIALLQHIEPVLAIAREALDESVAARWPGHPALARYVAELVEYSRLRRHNLLDSRLEPEATFRFAFDEIMRRGFRVDPTQFELRQPRTMRFWHDEVQAREIDALRRTEHSPVLLARSFIYPTTDPGVNPYLRRARFC